MERFIYRAWIRQGEEEAAIKACNEAAENVQKLVKAGELMTASMFRWGRHLFVYFECTGREYSPVELFSSMDNFLEPWPGAEGERFWVRMMDIYHCVEPVSVEHWRRKTPAERTAKLMRLKPEMLSSYIFYHWQLQEETPGDWAKYASIYLNENLTIMFTENPDPIEPPPYKGKLDTRNTPSAIWSEFMFSHCIPWEDVTDQDQRMWRKTEVVWSFFE